MQPAYSSNEVVSTRVLPASRERVWRAFSDGEELARWWGPRGFTNTFHEFDLRGGGAWRFTMTGPDGARFEQRREFIEVMPQQRIVLVNDDPAHRFRMTIEFEARANGTSLVWSMAFEDAAEFARVKDIIAASNEENFDRLAAALAKHG